MGYYIAKYPSWHFFQWKTERKFWGQFSFRATNSVRLFAYLCRFSCKKPLFLVPYASITSIDFSNSNASCCRWPVYALLTFQHFRKLEASYCTGWIDILLFCNNMLSHLHFFYSIHVLYSVENVLKSIIFSQKQMASALNTWKSTAFQLIALIFSSAGV